MELLFLGKRDFVITAQKITCDICNTRINQVEQFEASLSELKKLPPNDSGHMLVYYTEIEE